VGSECRRRRRVGRRESILRGDDPHDVDSPVSASIDEVASPDLEGSGLL